MTRSHKIAVVILNWNGVDFLKNFLPDVLKHLPDDGIVYVADNASSDTSVEYITEHFAEVRLIQLEKNYGFAGGYNEALKQVEAMYYVLLNSDVEVTGRWIEPVIALMDGDEDIAICQPKILSYHNKSMFEHAGAAGGWIDKYGYPFAMGRVFDYCEEDQGQYDAVGPVFWASGAAFFIKARLYHLLQGFDPYFFAHQEEIDLCWRAQLAGYKVYTCPQSVVYHVGGGTLPKTNAFKTYLNFRNNLIMMSKNLRGVQRFNIFARLVLDGVAALRFLLKGDTVFFMSVLKAHGGFWRWVFSKKKRMPPVPVARKYKIWGQYNGSIIWQHFVNRKNKFSEIVD